MRLVVAPLLGACVLVAGCGGSGTSGAPSGTSTAAGPAATTTTATQTGSSGNSPSPLQAEANSAAAGDVPDNQKFVNFRDAASGYAMKYPEGWAQQGGGPLVTIRDKNNVVRIVVRPASPPTAASVRRDLAGLPGVHVRSGPERLTLAGEPALKVVYTTRSAPNTVTGKRVTLVVDRYYLAHGGQEAVVDLGTPEGVDNVDAYRLMIQSFRWR